MQGQIERAQLNPRHARRSGEVSRRRSLVRRGFSLLEILVVIGIILLLVGIAVLGFSALNPSGRATKVTLSNLHAMLGAYEAQAGLREQPQVVYVNNASRPTTGTNAASLWAHETTVPNPPGAGQPDVADLTSGTANNGRTMFDGVANAQRVYNFLNRIPSNKQSISAIPSKQVLGQVEGANRGGKLLGPTGNARQLEPPLILDAWSNPVVFVGSVGLTGVTFEAQRSGTGAPPRRKVTSVGIFDPGVPTPQTARPFFASGGPDGNIRTGDDNVYSFEN